MLIAVASENGEVFQHFGHTPEFTVYEIEGGVVRGKRVLPTGDSGHGALAGFLRDLCVDLLICGGIGAGAQQALAEEGIKLVAGVQGTVDAVVTGYLNGTLKFATDFTCTHHHDHGEGDGHEHGGPCGGHCKH